MRKTNRDKVSGYHKLKYAAQLQREYRRREIKKNLTEALIVLLAACTWLALAYFAVTVAVGDF